MPRKTPRATRKLRDRDPLWAELAKAEGIHQSDIGEFIDEQVATTAKAKRRNSRNFEHPTPDEKPTVGDMLDQLSIFNSRNGFGPIGLVGSRALALRLETDLYNAWVQMQCSKLGQLSPGTLSDDQFSERYWEDGDEES